MNGVPSFAVWCVPPDAATPSLASAVSVKVVEPPPKAIDARTSQVPTVPLAVRVGDSQVQSPVSPAIGEM